MFLFGKYHYILHQNIGRIFFLKLTEMNCYLIMLLLPPLSSHMSTARKLTPHTVLEVSGHILNIWNICMKYHCLVWFECKVCYQIKLKPHAVLAVKVVIYWLDIFWRHFFVFLYVYLSKLSNHADISNSGRKWSFFCHSTRKWWCLSEVADISSLNPI